MNPRHFRDFIQIAGVRDLDEARLLMECGIKYLGFPLRLNVYLINTCAKLVSRSIIKHYPDEVGLKIRGPPS